MPVRVSCDTRTGKRCCSIVLGRREFITLFGGAPAAAMRPIFQAPGLLGLALLAPTALRAGMGALLRSRRCLLANALLVAFIVALASAARLSRSS
jgi:hypothetical protein